MYFISAFRFLFLYMALLYIFVLSYFQVLIPSSYASLLMLLQYLLRAIMPSL